MYINNFPRSKVNIKLELSINDTRWHDETIIQDIVSHCSYIIEYTIQYIFSNPSSHPSIRISLLLTNNYTLKYLNNKFRQINKATNILSFPFYNWAPKESKKCMYSRERIFFGDIAISFNKISRESIKFNHYFQDYFDYILTHGILHLIGYQHNTSDETNTMDGLKQSILRRIHQ